VRRTLLAGLCLLTVLAPARAQTADQKKETVAYLQKLQTKEGGFLTAPGQGQPGVRATSSALRALKYFGGSVPDKAACERFVKGCFDRSTGGFADRPGGKPDVYATAIGTLAVAELKLPTAPYAEPVVKYLGEHAKGFEEIRIAAAGLEAVHQLPPQAADWLREIARTRNADGTYGHGDGTARATGGAVVAVLRLGGKVPHPEAVVKALDAGQRKDGGFGKEGAAGSDLETSYREVRAYHMLKAKPHNARGLREFIARCRNEDGGYGVAPRQKSSVSGTYFAGIILHWLDEK
jgi:prenyltransferase beta subunit